MGSEDDETVTMDERRPGTNRGAAGRITGGRYQVGEAIGLGGMGEVLAAHDTQLGREVAIKRLRAKTPSERQVQRFLREAHIQGRLAHPAIAPVHELGRDNDGLPFFAMKRLAGTTLAAILVDGDRERFGRQRLLRAFSDVCLALEYAHVHGVVHRDLKPDNIMLGEYGEVYVLDWGVAKVRGEVDDTTFDDLRSAGQTVPGVAIGTPGFMAPEQALGDPTVDGRADVFALGRVLALILQRDGDPAPELEALRDRACESDADDRIASARELGEAVQRFLDGDRDLELRRRLAREHLDVARDAFIDGDRQAVAMRAAARALALDPHLPGAAELVGRLMLEPPREVPPEVRRAVLDDDRSLQRDTARVGLYAHVALLVAVGLLVAAHVYGYALMLLSAGMLSAAPAWLALRGSFVPPRVLLFTSAPLVAALCRVFSPVAGAGIAGLVSMLVATNPRLRAWRTLTALSIAVFASPVLELAGVIPKTFFVNGSGFRLDVPEFHGSELLVYALTTVFVGSLVVASVTIGRIIRKSERAMRHKLQLQAWQLAHLVPATSSL